MHFKPYVPLAIATLCAGAGAGVIVSTADPYTAEPLMMALFWIALFLTVWGLVATVLTALRQPALGIGFLWASAVVGLVAASRIGYHSVRLSGGAIFATLVISIVLWIRSKKSAKQPLISSENSATSSN